MNPADRYLADRVLTATPAQLTGMLFEALTASVRGCVRLQEAGDFAGALPRSLKAQSILLELRNTLDHGVGGELSRSHDALYTWSHSNLVRANREKDPTGSRSVLEVVEQLTEAWNEGCLGLVRSAA